MERVVGSTSKYKYSDAEWHCCYTVSMEYKETVLPIMRGMRELLLSQWGTAEITENKGDTAVSVVTEIDTAVEKSVAASLAVHFPEISFVGEEYGGDRSAERFWLMDPIDGTAHYIRGLPFCTSMLALIENGRVIFSVIYDFVNDDMYWASLGNGAFKNDTPIQVSNRSLADAYIGFESHLQKPENLQKHMELYGKTVIVKVICAGWEYVQVAQGKTDGRITHNPFGKDYDYAPGSLLVSEAGGVVANIGLSTYDYQNLSFLACGPSMYKELTEGDGAIFPVRS